MPHLELLTNIPTSNIPATFAQELCQIVAHSLGKPLEYCVVSVRAGTQISWGGSTDEACQATLMSIGALSPESNKKHSKAIFEYIQKALNIRGDRMYIHFVNAKSSDVGYNGTTFQSILG